MSLSPIQRAYLVGQQDGLELRGPAQYYLGCDLDPRCVPGIGERLRNLVCRHEILRTTVNADLSLSVLPVAAARVDAEVRPVDDVDFAAVNDAVRRDLTRDAFEFSGWPLFRVIVVRSKRRARLHLGYALWLMDAASLAVFLAQLAGDQQPVPIAPAPASVRDRSSRDERFWRARAASLPGPAELPLRPDWRYAGPAVSHRVVTIDADRAGRITRIASESGITAAMTFLTVYGATLGRLGGGAAHTVTVLHARADPPDRLGNRGNTMPLEVPASGDASFLELARAVQARYLSQAMHSSLSGVEIARLADPTSALARLPYPYAFTAIEVDALGEARLGLRRRWDEIQLRVPQVLIDHQVISESDGIVRLGFDWRTDAFDPGFVDDLITQYTELATTLTDPARWTHRPPVAVGRPYAPRPARPAPDTLHGRVLRTAAQFPDSPAVHDRDGTLSYAELVEHAGAVAGLLRDAGAQPGDRVAVHLRRGRGQVVGILGALLAGCVYIPLDHGTPTGRLGGIARRAGIRFAITDEPAADWARCGAQAIAPVDTRPRPRADLASSPPQTATAYVIFTSGSTGEPKGVVISHAAALATIDAVNTEFGVQANDRVLSVSSIGFDLSVYDIFGPLLRGGSVVMLSEDTARDPAAWAESIARHGVTIWNSAPALAALLAEEGLAAASIRAFLLSGDWIPLTLPAALRHLAPGAEVISLGGATEGAIWSIYHRITSADRTGRSIPYGRPLPGQDVLVLDARRDPCADWAIGELCIAGAGVADGYLNDPDKTSMAFLDDPRYGWIYRTGDRGRRHPGGVIEFLGRTDTQVKLNGHRVELGEIEHVLAAVPGIRGCAASVRGDGRRKRLVAFATLAPDAATSWRADAYAALRDALPRYMVPDIIVELDEIPLTGNGKVDHRRLATVPVDDAPTDTAPAPRPHDLSTHEVALCWQEILGEPPGPGTFFSAGGGSFDAIRLLSALRGRFGYRISFGEFMADPTLSGLAALCRRTRTATPRGVWAVRPRASAAARLRLVLFPPVGGGISGYTSLIRALAGDIDVHAIGFDAPTGASTLPELAALCTRYLPDEARCADVPLVFAGWSFGGALAVEAARGFDESVAATRPDARPVARVIVIDTPVRAESRDGDMPSIDGFLHDIRQTSGVSLDPAQVTTDPVLHNRFAVYRRNLTLLRNWAPEPTGLALIECRATDRPAEPDLTAWPKFAQVAEVITLAGGHFDVLTGDNLDQIRTAIESVTP